MHIVTQNVCPEGILELSINFPHYKLTHEGQRRTEELKQSNLRKIKYCRNTVNVERIQGKETLELGRSLVSRKLTHVGHE